jgi:glucose/arabinose dehydrogenase
MLYIAVGDGGSGGDPQQNGQSLKTFLGKILRIDVNPKDTAKAYAVPADNPFVGKTEAKPEIWSWGMRNPWRFSFDRKTGLLWAADVGQNKWEEIDIIEKGKNYGWSAMEGTHEFKPERAVGELTGPIKEYGHEVGPCIIGGYVYRGTQNPSLDGIYIYGDFIGKVFGLRCAGNGKPLTLDTEFLKLPFQISSFGEDKDGELYILSYPGGQVYRIGQ